MDGKTPPPAVRLTRIAVVRGDDGGDDDDDEGDRRSCGARAAAAVILFCSAGVLIAISQACASKDRRGCWEGGENTSTARCDPSNDWVGQASRPPPRHGI